MSELKEYAVVEWENGKRKSYDVSDIKNMIGWRTGINAKGGRVISPEELAEEENEKQRRRLDFVTKGLMLGDITAEKITVDLSRRTDKGHWINEKLIFDNPLSLLELSKVIQDYLLSKVEEEHQKMSV